MLKSVKNSFSPPLSTRTFPGGAFYLTKKHFLVITSHIGKDCKFLVKLTTCGCSKTFEPTEILIKVFFDLISLINLGINNIKTCCCFREGVGPGCISKIDNQIFDGFI